VSTITTLPVLSFFSNTTTQSSFLLYHERVQKDWEQYSIFFKCQSGGTE
jgi:hypothetical protein